LQIVLRK